MSIYNDDELVAPSWIDKEFLEKVLTQYENKDKVEIIKFDLTPASMRGDHYASVMFRCKVEYRCACLANQTKSIIIKTLPMEDSMKREMLAQTRLFETEIEMYNQTLPKIEKVLAECGEPTKLAAEIIYHALEPHKVIILEDLCEAGYDTLRCRYLTEDEVKAIYRKVAKLHAVSYMLGQSENHEIVTKYRDGFFNIPEIMAFDIMKSGIETFIKMLASYEEFAVYLEKITAMHPDLTESCMALFNAYKLNNGKGDIFVLNHGDFHLKNMMFKLNKENNVEDIMMVDYQISAFAPSNIDIFYSQFMMLSPDQRLRKNELRQYYFSEFTKTLTKIKYPGEMPRFSDFQIAGIKYRHFAIFLMSTLLPMIYSMMVPSIDDLKDVHMDKIIENPDLMTSNYYNPDFINDLRNFLPILLNEGYLD